MYAFFLLISWFAKSHGSFPCSAFLYPFRTRQASWFLVFLFQGLDMSKKQRETRHTSKVIVQKKHPFSLIFFPLQNKHCVWNTHSFKVKFCFTCKSARMLSRTSSLILSKKRIPCIWFYVNYESFVRKHSNTYKL